MKGIKITINKQFKMFNSTKSRTIEEIRSKKNDGYKEMSASKADLLRYVAELEEEHGVGNVNMEILANGQVHISTTNFVTQEEIIDGHFWVETPDGEVYNDLTGAEHVAKFEARGETAVYLPANPDDEARFIAKKMKLVQENIDKVGSEEEYYQSLANKRMNGFDCFQNATLMAYQTGYRMRYGHFGAMKPNGMIYWYFGHPRNKYEDFEVKKDKKDYKSGDTHYSNHPYLLEKHQRQFRLKQEAKERAKAIQKAKDDAEFEVRKAQQEKAEAELFAMLDSENNKKKSKKQNNKKSKK